MDAACDSHTARGTTRTIGTYGYDGNNYARGLVFRVVPRNVLFAPLLGYRKEDWARLERTIHECDATRVRLLTLPIGLDTKPEVREHIRSQLRAITKQWPRFEWDERHVDLFSFEEVLQALAVLFREEEGNAVSVALGTGGSPGAVAGTISCLLWRARGVYIGDANYEKPPVFLPDWLALEGPLTKDELRVLSLVVSEPDGLDKKTLVSKLKKMGQIRPDQDKHAYRRLATDFLPKLQEHGFVTVGPRDGWDGRSHFVVATDEGRRAHRVLSPMLGEAPTRLHIRGRSRPRKNLAL